MTFTYTAGTDLGRIRLMIPDRVSGDAFFSDEELSDLLAIEGDYRRATALALETMASDQAMVLKVTRVLDLSTDGTRVADSLIKRAEKLREQADRADAQTDGGAFDIAEWVVDDFAYRERLVNEELRNG